MEESHTIRYVLPDMDCSAILDEFNDAVHDIGNSFERKYSLILVFRGISNDLDVQRVSTDINIKIELANVSISELYKLGDAKTQEKIKVLDDMYQQFVDLIGTFRNYINHTLLNGIVSNSDTKHARTNEYIIKGYRQLIHKDAGSIRYDDTDIMERLMVVDINGKELIDGILTNDTKKVHADICRKIRKLTYVKNTQYEIQELEKNIHNYVKVLTNEFKVVKIK
jgi:hypothetical protein